jgi:hypothetical protein
MSFWSLHERTEGFWGAAAPLGDEADERWRHGGVELSHHELGVRVGVDRPGDVRSEVCFGSRLEPRETRERPRSAGFGARTSMLDEAAEPEG